MPTTHLVLAAPSGQQHTCVQIEPRLAWRVASQLRTSGGQPRVLYLEQARHGLQAEPCCVRLVTASADDGLDYPETGAIEPTRGSSETRVRFELVAFRGDHEQPYPICVAGAVGWVLEAGLPLYVEQRFLSPAPDTAAALLCRGSAGTIRPAADATTGPVPHPHRVPAQSR